MQFTEREIPLSHGARELDLGAEGGHSKRRILHAKDITGREIERALLAAVRRAAQHRGVREPHGHRPHHQPEAGLCRRQPLPRASMCSTNRPGRSRPSPRRSPLLATGGCGKVYLYTTNPDIATGDGVAMAWRAGAAVANMEFIQFHPTCLYHPKAKSFLISEAVRGRGRRAREHRRASSSWRRYHPLKSLAPRDIVARAIDSEMKKSGADCVLLDITHKPARFLMDRFPNIYQTCLGYGIDMTKEPIPVVPAAHYQCGGVLTNVDGETEITGPLRRGRSGLHRAARGQPAGQQLAAGGAGVRPSGGAQRVICDSPNPPTSRFRAWHSGNATNPDEMVVVSHNWDEIRRLHVGLRGHRAHQQAPAAGAAAHRQPAGRKSRSTIWDFIVTSDLLELRNIATVAELNRGAPCAVPRAADCTTIWIIPIRIRSGRNRIRFSGSCRNEPRGARRSPKS